MRFILGDNMNEYKKYGSFKKDIFTAVIGETKSKHIQLYVGKFFATSRDGLVEIIKINTKKNVDVRFVNTKYEFRGVLKANLTKGKCSDGSITDRTWPTTYPNQKYTTNTSGDLIVLSKKGKICEVVFCNTGYKTKAYIDNVKAGKVGDPYAKTRYGVGYTGEGMNLHYWKQARSLWSNMLKRCYSKHDPRGYFGRDVEVVVADEWLCFMTFMYDLQKLQNFDSWLLGQKDKSQPQYNLDKDFAYQGCSEYSRSNCQFIEESLNKSTTSKNPLSASNIRNYQQMLGKTNGN